MWTDRKCPSGSREQHSWALLPVLRGRGRDKVGTSLGLLPERPSSLLSLVPGGFHATVGAYSCLCPPATCCSVPHAEAASRKSASCGLTQETERHTLYLGGAGGGGEDGGASCPWSQHTIPQSHGPFPRHAASDPEHKACSS